MSHVYLSYSRRDADFVDLIEDDLNERGHPVWRDTSSVSQDEAWETAIESALETAYAALIFISKNGLDSEWVQNETVKTRQSQTPRVVLLLEPCEVPQALQEDPIVDISRVQGAAGLDQLRYYRHGLQSLIDQLDSFYPVRRHMLALEHTDDRVRQEAARDLGELGDLRASEALIQSLSDPDIDVRFAATEAIGKLKSESAQKSLIRLMETDEDPDVQAAAAGALGSIGLPGAISPLIAQLDNPDRFVRQAAILALGNLRAGVAVPPLVHLMRNNPIFDVRQAAIQALCSIGGPVAERALRRTGVDCDQLESSLSESQRGPNRATVRVTFPAVRPGNSRPGHRRTGPLPRHLRF